MKHTKYMKSNDFTPKQLERLDKEQRIVKLYTARQPDGTRRYLTSQIATELGVSTTTVWRAAVRWGVAQGHAEANAMITKLKRPTRMRRTLRITPRDGA